MANGQNWQPKHNWEIGRGQNICSCPSLKLLINFLLTFNNLSFKIINQIFINIKDEEEEEDDDDDEN